MKKKVTDGPRDDISCAIFFVSHHSWTVGSGV